MKEEIKRKRGRPKKELPPQKLRMYEVRIADDWIIKGKAYSVNEAMVKSAIFKQKMIEEGKLILNKLNNYERTK